MSSIINYTLRTKPKAPRSRAIVVASRPGAFPANIMYLEHTQRSIHSIKYSRVSWTIVFPSSRARYTQFKQRINDVSPYNTWPGKSAQRESGRLLFIIIYYLFHLSAALLGTFFTSLAAVCV